MLAGDWRPKDLGGLTLRGCVPAAFEGRLQEVAASDLDATGVDPEVTPPSVTPPEMTTVVEGVAGTGGASSGVSLGSLNVGAFGFKPDDKERLPNLPPSAAVIGIELYSFSSMIGDRSWAY